jgi:exosortase E/protease (VPEID-CTERM system)
MRLLVFGGLLLAEYLLVSVLFDARALRAAGGGLSALGYLGDAAAIALVATAAALGLMGPTLRRAVAALPAVEVGAAPRLGIAIHLAAYAAFLAVTAQLFAGAHTPSAAWLPAWLVAGVAVGATWLPLAVPWPALRAVGPRVSGAASIGAAAGVVAWAAGEASAQVWRWMAPITLAAVSTLLRLALPDVIVDPAAVTIGTPDFTVQIAPICSGFEGIGLIAAFLGGYLFLERARLRFPRALWLLPAGIVCVWIANAVRIAALIAIGSKGWPDVALGGFHSKAGWLLFSAIALAFIAYARGSRYFAAAGEDGAAGAAPAAGAEDVVAPWLMPQLALLAGMLVTGLVTADFDAFYALRIACAACAIWIYRARYRALAWAPHGDSLAIGAAVFVVWQLLARGGDATGARALELGLERIGPLWAALWLCARTLGSVLVVPFAEELAFRGYLLRRLVSARFTEVDPRVVAPLAYVASSLAFGALHRDVLAATLAGLAYALAQQRRGRVTDAVIAHATTNLLLACDALFLDHWRWFA